MTYLGPTYYCVGFYLAGYRVGMWENSGKARYFEHMRKHWAPVITGIAA